MKPRRRLSVQIIDMLITIFLIIISTSLTAPTQPSPRFHVEAWLPFRNREMDYSRLTYPQQAPVWPCSSVNLVRQQWSAPKGQIILSLSTCGVISFLRLSFGIFTQHFLVTSTTMYCSHLYMSPVCTVTHFKINYLLTESEFLTGNTKLEPCCIDYFWITLQIPRTITWSQGSVPSFRAFDVFSRTEPRLQVIVRGYWSVIRKRSISQFHNHAQNVQAAVLAGHTSCKLDGLYDWGEILLKTYYNWHIYIILQKIFPLIHTMRRVYGTCGPPKQRLVRSAHDCETGLLTIDKQGHRIESEVWYSQKRPNVRG